MKRRLSDLAQATFDVVVIGGGIYGACVAWDAALRGLSVALIEKGDFGAATSANSLKIIHGGLRYLQQADVGRMRASIQERTTLMRIAPHLVHPLPVLIPTYGHGRYGKELLALALWANDMISLDRNRHADSQKRLPAGRVLSRQACLQLVSDLPQSGLTGAAIFWDAQVYNAERLVLGFVQSAAGKGAVVANYVAATGILERHGRITDICVRDELSGSEFLISARAAINTTGPWVNHIRRFQKEAPRPARRFAKAINLVTRQLFETYALGLTNHAVRSSSNKRGDGGLLFVAPWRDRSLVGTTYAPYDEDPGAVQATEQEINALLTAVRTAAPDIALRREDVMLVHGGLVPLAADALPNGPLRLARQYEILTDSTTTGLISVVGVKYTTARHVAEKTVDLLFKRWGYTPAPSSSSVTALTGGAIPHWNTFVTAAMSRWQGKIDANMLNDLVRNYGTNVDKVLDDIDTGARDGQPDYAEAVAQAQVRYALREEMAQTLDDIVLRRTGWGATGPPDDRRLRLVAEVMQAERPANVRTHAPTVARPTLQALGPQAAQV